MSVSAAPRLRAPSISRSSRPAFRWRRLKTPVRGSRTDWSIRICWVQYCRRPEQVREQEQHRHGRQVARADRAQRMHEHQKTDARTDCNDAGVDQAVGNEQVDDDQHEGHRHAVQQRLAPRIGNHQEGKHREAGEDGRCAVGGDAGMGAAAGQRDAGEGHHGDRQAQYEQGQCLAALAKVGHIGQRERQVKHAAKRERTGQFMCDDAALVAQESRFERGGNEFTMAPADCSLDMGKAGNGDERL
jgi:hypothetical protein